MSSNTLSAVLEKQIHRLCLRDFPCGYGSWRKTKENAQGAEREETDALLDLLSCRHSPWWHDGWWSPQAAALSRLAVLTPERLHADFIHSYFTTLRIVDKGVSVVDGGLLKFSKLEELVLSANSISEVPAENLPNSLKILELRANRLSSLSTLTRHRLPPLHYLGLGSNFLGSRDDVSHLTGRHWPQLVCLDLSDCEFQDQRALLSALSTLPCLRTLVLEGNPLTLACCYPGFTVDSLPRLSCLDASWISSEERHRFRGLTQMNGLIVDQASATVSVGRMRGIPDPLMGLDDNAPDFPVVTYSYFITYEFFSHQTLANMEFSREPKVVAAAKHVAADSSFDAGLQASKNCEKETWSEEACHDIAHVSSHTTSKLTWSECMDFTDTHTHVVRDLGGLKRFFSRGLYLRLEEEKVLSWPAASDDMSVAKPTRSVKEKKGAKGKESPIKSASTKDKSKDKKKKSVAELVQDAPVRRVLGSAHVPLQSLVQRAPRVDVLCDFGVLSTESEDLRKKREDKKENKESPQRGGSGTQKKNTAASKGKEKGRKGCETEGLRHNVVSMQLEPVMVELSVELEKWPSASASLPTLKPPQQTGLAPH